MKNFDQIERYLNGEMPESERQSFEQEMAQNPELAEEVRLQRFEEDAIGLMIEDDLLAKIKQIGKEKEAGIQLVSKKNKSFLQLRWVQLAAAASVLLIAVFAIYNLSSSQLSAPELAALSYDQRVPNFSSIRTTDADEQEEYNKYSAYITNKEKQSMPETIRFFSEQKSLDALYKVGHAYLLNSDFTQAIESFTAYLSTASKTDRDFKSASFYLALAYLGNNNASTAQSILSEIKANPDHIFQKDAEDILKKLEELE